MAGEQFTFSISSRWWIGCDAEQVTSIVEQELNNRDFSHLPLGSLFEFANISNCKANSPELTIRICRHQNQSIDGIH